MGIALDDSQIFAVRDEIAEEIRAEPGRFGNQRIALIVAHGIAEQARGSARRNRVVAQMNRAMRISFAVSHLDAVRVGANLELVPREYLTRQPPGLAIQIARVLKRQKRAGNQRYHEPAERFVM